MSAGNPARRTDTILVGVFVAVLAAHFWITTRNWTSQFLIGHEFRQTQTAVTTHYIEQQDNFSLLYETPIVGKPWVSILMEVPIYEWSVVGVSRWWHLPQHVAARTITLGCFYLMLPAVFLLLGRLGLSPARRLLVLALILACPVYIFYSRAFLMDSMELMFCAWFLWAYVTMMDRRRWYWFVVTSLVGTGAALVKSATLAIWLWPAAAYVVAILWREWRGRLGWKALGQTAFWGLAGVTIPLGALRWWVLLTDPIKAAHPSAWIFTSENLSVGNWGLNDLGARISPRVWGVLAERWNDGIMAPWLLLLLLVSGLVFLPKVRRPVGALAGVFFWAQLLFPYAYAYQDYYFYSCALFLSAAFGCLALGLLDSRAPRWLSWLLIIVPFVGHGLSYYRTYWPQQSAASEGGFNFTMVIRDMLPRDSVIVVAGADWSAIIPYYSQRKALLVRNGLENDGRYLDRAFADLVDEDVSALILVGTQRSNYFIVEKAAKAFGTDLQPSFYNATAEVYVNLHYRDELKKYLENAGNYGDLVNKPMPPAGFSLSDPRRISPANAAAAFDYVLPLPIRSRFQFGLGYVWIEGKRVIFAHPDCDLWVRAPSQATRIEWDFGMVPDAYLRAGDKTDGVELTVAGISASGRREIFRRYLDPVVQAGDRGTQTVVVPYQPLPGEILEFSNRQGRGGGFDWTYWSRIEVK